MNTNNNKLVEAMKQFKAVKTVIFQEEFYKAVVESTFYVPIAIDKTEGNEKSGKYCVLSTPSGRRFLATFTSPTELEKCYGEREDIIAVQHPFSIIRDIVIKEGSNLNGFIIDAKGENVAITREEMLPKNN